MFKSAPHGYGNLLANMIQLQYQSGPFLMKIRISTNDLLNPGIYCIGPLEIQIGYLLFDPSSFIKKSYPYHGIAAVPSN